MLVIDGDAASTGNGTTGAFGKGSTAGAGAAAGAAADTIGFCDGLGGAGFGAGAGGFASTFGAGGVGGGATGLNAGMATVFGDSDLGFRGRSHVSHRIPAEISRPHMKHFEAI